MMGKRSGRVLRTSSKSAGQDIAACAHDISVSQLAQQGNINANMLFTWRRELHADLFKPATPALLPVSDDLFHPPIHHLNTAGGRLALGVRRQHVHEQLARRTG